jgi:hypothetical protein
MMHRQKREASDFLRAEALEKTQDLGKRRTKKCDKKHKYKLCDGPIGMFMNAVTKACEPCPKGQEPSAKGDKCETPENQEERNNRGNCPPGKIMDPTVPNQVSWTPVHHPP